MSTPINASAAEQRPTATLEVEDRAPFPLRRIHESLDGSTASVDVLGELVHLVAYERGADSAVLAYNLDEVDELIAGLTAARDYLTGDTKTAPERAGAAPTEQASAPLADDHGGHTRTQATGPSTAWTGLGRPTFETGSFAERFPEDALRIAADASLDITPLGRAQLRAEKLDELAHEDVS